MQLFEAIDRNKSLPDIEKDILDFWDGQGIFEKSLSRTGSAFVFYDGPPFATGLPHYGHLLAGTIKDIVPRYWTMRGRYVERRFGWDCHGLPVENEIEKSLNLSGKKQIESYGVDRFNEACRSIVLRYTREWEKTVRRMGRWVDFTNGYKTMDKEYMESVWWVFRQLWDKGLIYHGRRVQPYCPRCCTPLSNFETNQGYRDVQDPSIIIHLPLQSRPETSILVWTTTPWTLPSNVAVAVGADMDYVEVQDGPRNIIMAQARLGSYFKDPNTCTILQRFKGRDLVGEKYCPVFPFFKDVSSDFFTIVEAEFVKSDDGTGLVHIAPAFGEDDYEIGLKRGWPLVLPVDEEGRFTAQVPPYQGLEVKAADKRIIADIKAQGTLVRQATIQHSYPHCYRCDSPLIYLAISTWFCRVEPLKQDMIRNNRQIRWVPEHLRDGRFGLWLENARDWNLSRNRYWGTPIPVWMCKNGHTCCIGSIQELRERCGHNPEDLHKHFVDSLTFACEVCGSTMHRIPEVLDCWFESGSMPYAQHHYPFENKEKVEQNFPADFIAEGLDQTRGWFYTLLVVGTALFNKPPFRNVIVNGLILAEDGKKMSKRLRNYPDPEEIISRHGADALRLFMINSPVVRAEDLRFSEKGILEVLRSVLLPFWNAYLFFVTYANQDSQKNQLCWRPSDQYRSSSNELDRWIMSELQSLTDRMIREMENYRLDRVVPSLVEFVDMLTNWYIRRSRDRFWSTTDTQDKNSAYAALYEVLVTFCKLLAPFLPFLPEAVYRSLIAGSGRPEPESVHLCPFPSVIEERIDRSLEERMAIVRQVVFLGRSLRAAHQIKTRQPLSAMTIVTRNTRKRAIIQTMEKLVREELNLHRVEYGQEDQGLVSLVFKPNFRALGKRLGKEMNAVAGIIGQWDADILNRLEHGENISVLGHQIALADVIVERKVQEGLAASAHEDITVILDIQISRALVLEGLANEITNRIQNLRKEQQLEFSDTITMAFCTDDPLLREVLEGKHAEFIRTATLAVRLEAMAELPGGKMVEIEGRTLKIGIQKV